MTILLSVALHSEAKPLISALKLKLQEDKGFLLYGNENFRLVVTGVGKTAMAAGTAFLYATLRQETIQGFLNIGIAGHGLLPVGTAILAHKVIETSSNKCYFPTLCFSWDRITETVATVENIETDFHKPYCYEMEASAFFQTALHFTNIEKIHCLKIISDNSLKDADKLTKDCVSHLIENRLEAIQSLIDKMQNLQEPREKHDFTSLFERVHFTHSQKQQLHATIQNLTAQKKDIPSLTHFTSAKDVLKFLENQITSCYML